MSRLVNSCPCDQLSAESAASGALSKIRSSAFAGPAGKRLPCSQLRTVSTGTPSREAKSACVSPVRRRTRRAYDAASCAPAASSSAAWRRRSASVVASTLRASIRPATGLPASSFTRTVPIARHLLCICLAGGNNAQRIAARRIDDQEQKRPDAAKHSKTRLAIIEAFIAFDQAIRIEENLDRIGEVETSTGKTGFALGVVPLEVHGHHIGQRTTKPKPYFQPGWGGRA